MDEFLAELTEPLFRFLVRLTRDRELAADLTQDALLRAWRDRLSLREERARRVWVYRIALNLYRDDRRRHSSQRREQVEWEQFSSADPSPEAQASHAEVRERTLRVIDQLPQRQREVIYLRVVEQLLPREIAQVLGIDAGVVRSNLAAARKRLRSLLPDLLSPSATEAKSDPKVPQHRST